MLSLVMICAPARRIRLRALGTSSLLQLDTLFREDVHVIAVIEKVQGGLQHAGIRLRRLI